MSIAPESTAASDDQRDARHAVQFYETDAYLCNQVVEYIAGGLAAGAPVLVIATARHCDDFTRGLTARGIAVTAATTSGALVFIEVERTLEALVVDGRPDASRFQTLLGDAIGRSCARTRASRVRAYGELVDVMWRSGNEQGAIRLEELWNELAELHDFDLLCGYTLANFHEPRTQGLHEVCRLHHHEIDVEKRVPNGTPATPIDEHVRALAAEIARRSQVEEQLRQALAKLQESEERERARAAHLAQLVDELVETVRLNELLTGVLAHDLRNPLGAITTAAQLAQHRGGDQAPPLMARIVTSAHRMARMIDQLLDFTRIRVGGGLPLDPAPLDLEPVLAHVLDELREPVRTDALRVAHVGDTRGAWDSDRLAQAFSNLIGNAIQHGASGAISIRVDGTHPDHVCVRIQNGGAIPAALLPHLFEPMSGGLRQGAGGLGLGLYITREIVTAHGGTITVEPSDTTTAFLVVLPRRIPAHAPPAPDPAPANDRHDAAGAAARSPALFAKALAEK